MPIPKVGDVIELTGQPWTGAWKPLTLERYWIVESVAIKSYITVSLRGLLSGKIATAENTTLNRPTRISWPLEEQEIVINEFLSAANHAILNNAKENQPDEPASK